MGIFKSFENFAPTATYSSDSIEAATAMYEAAASCEAIANQLSAILDDYKLAGEIMVAGKKDSSEAFKAFVGDSLRMYASTEEAKDNRKFWDKVKEFFIRLWHSVQDFFAKFSVFASMTRSKLAKLNIKDIYDGVSKTESELEVAKVKFSFKLEDLNTAQSDIVWSAPAASADGQKLSEYAKNLKAALKALREGGKLDNEIELTLANATKIRTAMLDVLDKIIKGRTNVVNGFKQAVDEVKGGVGVDGDTNKKLRINALKDARHAQLMTILTLSKIAISNSKALIAGVKKVKKKKAA